MGYAYPVGATTSEYPAKTVTVTVGPGAPTTLFTAIAKTKVKSVLVTNTSGGILPVTLFVDKGDGNKIIGKSRVLKTQYMVLELVSSDTRVDVKAVGNENDILTEFTLSVGDILLASCPIEDAVNISVNLAEGVK